MRETRYTRLQSRSSGLESTALKSHIPVPGPVTARQDTIVVVLLAVVPPTALWTDFRESANPIDRFHMHTLHLATITAIALTSALMAAPAPSTSPQTPLPRTADGKPNLGGIWQAAGTAAADLQDHAARYNMPAGRSVVEGAGIPYQP